MSKIIWTWVIRLFGCQWDLYIYIQIQCKSQSRTLYLAEWQQVTWQSLFSFLPDHTLLKLKNVIIMPHLGIKTGKATYMITEEADENTLAALNGLLIPNEVLPSWWAKGYKSSLFIILFPPISSGGFYSHVFPVRKNLFQLGMESYALVSCAIKNQFWHFNFLVLEEYITFHFQP